jgi:hypothetical protein
MLVGAAQDMLATGFDSVAIMTAGGWKTQHVLFRYVENGFTDAIYRKRWMECGTVKTMISCSSKPSAPPAK